MKLMDLWKSKSEDSASFHTIPKGSNGFSPLELYEFDLNGFLIVRNFLSPEQVQGINRILDRDHSDKCRIEFTFLHLDPIFLDLMTNTRFLDVCEETLGKWFRFEEAFGVQDDPSQPKRDVGVNLHGGPWANQGSFQYQWINGRPHCGVLVFGINLRSVKQGDGGLVVVPGSHNQNVPITGKELNMNLLNGEFEKWPWVLNPALEPGDLVIFTEALIHGTAFWKPMDRARRILYYRYCPGHMTWRKYDQTNEQYQSLARNQLEKNLLRAPFVGWYDTKEHPRWQNHYRAPTREQPGEYSLDGTLLKTKP